MSRETIITKGGPKDGAAKKTVAPAGAAIQIGKRPKETGTAPQAKLNV